MRLLVRGLLLAGIASPAFAADIDNSWLRGSSSFAADPPSYRRWSGFYGGGQVGVDFRNVRFLDNGTALVAPAMGNAVAANDPVLTNVSAPGMPDLGCYNTKGPSFGGFVGYNYQIDDIVLGFEFNFNRAGMNASAGSSQSHTVYCHQQCWHI